MLASFLPGIGDSSKEEGAGEVASEVSGDGKPGAISLDWNDGAEGPGRTLISEAHNGNEPEGGDRDGVGTGAVGTCAVSTAVEHPL